MYCSHCGKKLSEDDFFCSNCGTKVIRHYVWSGDDEGQFDETLLFRPEDMNKQAGNITQNLSKPAEPVIEKFTWEDESRSPASVFEPKKIKRVSRDEEMPSLEDANPSAMEDGFDTIKESRVQSARAAERLRNRRTRGSDTPVMDHSIEQAVSTTDMPETGPSSGKQESFIDKLKRFGKKSEYEAENPFIGQVSSEDQAEAGEEKEKKDTKSNSMRTLVAGIVLIGLVVGIILGLFISKPWAKEDEALPENPTPLLTMALPLS